MGIYTQTKTISDSATLILNSNDDRSSSIIRNIGSENIYIGNSSVTTSNGYKLIPGDILNQKDNDNNLFSGAFYGICETGKTCDISILEGSYD